MKTTILSRIIALGIIMLASLPIMAQGRIDKLVNQLEKKAGVTVTYTENRNPKTKKIVKQSTILSGNNTKDADALWQAFEGERENSVKIVKTRNESFIIKFEDKNYQSSYVLSVHGGNWSLVISKHCPGFEDDSSLSSNFDFSGFDFSDLDLERLETLEALNSLGTLKLSGDVLVYDKDGNVIYQSQTSDKRNNPDGKRSKKSRSKSTSTSISRSGNGSSVRTVTTNVSDCSGGSAYTYIYSN